MDLPARPQGARPAAAGTKDPAAYEMQLSRRRAEYIAWVAEAFAGLEPEMAPTDGRRWSLNHARLVLNRDLAQANRYFESFALTQDADICFIRFLKTLLDFRHSPRLSDAAKVHLTSILVSWPVKEISTVARWPAIHTENHDLMHLTIGLFAQQSRGCDTAANVRQIDRSLTWRFQRGWVEWNSPCYQYHYLNPLMVLVDHAPCQALREKAGLLLDVLLAERALLGVNGYLGGPAFRCRTADANDSLADRKVAYLEDNRYDGLLPTVWLAFGMGEPRFDFATARVEGLLPAGAAYASGNEPRLKQDEGMLFACSAFRPHPVVTALAEESRTRPRLVYAGRRCLGWPRDDAWAAQRWQPASLHYYNTPHISLGSMHSSGWSHQTRYSNVMFAGDPSQGLRVEVILPGVTPDKRRHEARGRVVQHKNWLLGQGTLFEDGGVRPHRVGPWQVYRVGRGLCAHLELPDGYHLLQVSDLDTFASEDCFAEALSLPSREGQGVRGVTVDGDVVDVALKEMSVCINGQPRPHPPAMLHACEAMESEFGSGRITIRTGAGTVTFDGSAPCLPER